MSKLSHKQKVKLARTLLTSEEIAHHIPKFNSAAWDRRAQARSNKEKKRMGLK